MKVKWIENIFSLSGPIKEKEHESIIYNWGLGQKLFHSLFGLRYKLKSLTLFCLRSVKLPLKKKFLKLGIVILEKIKLNVNQA